MSTVWSNFESPDDHEDGEILQEALRSKITEGDNLLLLMTHASQIRGAQKLVKRISQEVNFLKKVSKQNRVKKEHVKCSNLGHLDALVKCVLEHCEDCAAVLEVFELHVLGGENKRICVDVVSEGGRSWVKVIARNPVALSLLSAGQGDYGQRTVIDQAKEFVECAQQHPFHFKAPKVTFKFANGIEVSLANTLEKLGVEVKGKRISRDDCDSNTESDDISEDDDGHYYDANDDVSRFTYMPMTRNEVQKTNNHESVSCDEDRNNSLNSFSEIAESKVEDRLNLDVTAMIAYVSSLTNGGCESYFKEPLLRQQAEWEQKNPAKPMLDELFKGKKLFCCSTAYKDFCSIIATLGGPAEKKRADELLQRLTVVSDQISQRTEQYLVQGGKVKPRSRIIFGTGDYLKAITVTANEGFVRAAKCQGMTFAVAFHESRALTEKKELLVDPYLISAT